MPIVPSSVMDALAKPYQLTTDQIEFYQQRKDNVPYSNKLDKYLEVGYQHSSDRTLTFVPKLAKAVSYVWDISVDKALVKTAQIMISQAAGLGTAALGASKAGLFAEGGAVGDRPAGLAELAVYNMG
jgi:hypothetical protein